MYSVVSTQILTGNLISFCVSWLKTFSIECKCYYRMFLNLGLCDGSPWVNSGYLRIPQNAVSFSVPYARRHAVTICSVSGDVNFNHFARQCLPGFSHEIYCLSYKQYLQRGIIYTSFAPQPSPTRFGTYWRLLPISTIIMCLLNGDFLGPSLTPHSLADVLLWGASDPAHRHFFLTVSVDSRILTLFYRLWPTTVLIHHSFLILKCPQTGPAGAPSGWVPCLFTMFP